MKQHIHAEGLGSQLAALAQMSNSGLTVEHLPHTDHVRPEATEQALGSNGLYFIVRKVPGAEIIDPLIFQDTLAGRPLRLSRVSAAPERIEQPQPHRSRRVGLSVLASRLHNRHYR